MAKKRAIVLVLNLTIILLLLGVAVKVFQISNNSLFAWVGARNQSYVSQLDQNKDNPKALRHLLDQHIATQERSAFAATKLDIYTTLIEYYLHNRNHQKCVDTAMELINFWDQNYEYFRLLGECELLEGNREKAFEAFSQAWQIKPTDPNTTRQMLTLTHIEGKTQEKEYIQSIYTTYPKAQGQIESFAGKYLNPLLSRAQFSSSNIKYSNQLQEIQLNKRSYSNEEIHEEVHIIFSEHPGSGTQIKLAEISIELENGQHLNFTNFSDWRLNNMTQLNGQLFSLDSLYSTMVSPKLDVDSPISSIKITIQFIDPLQPSI